MHKPQRYWTTKASQLGNRHVIEGGPSSVDQLPSFLQFELYCNYTQISSAPHDGPINNHLLLYVHKQHSHFTSGAYWRIHQRICFRLLQFLQEIWYKKKKGGGKKTHVISSTGEIWHAEFPKKEFLILGHHGSSRSNWHHLSNSRNSPSMYCSIDILQTHQWQTFGCPENGGKHKFHPVN